MNTTESLCPRVREAAFISSAAPGDYTDARICREMTDMLRGKFADMVVKSKGNYWLQVEPRTTTIGQPFYRMPNRACAGGLQQIQIAYDAGENYVQLDEVDEQQLLSYQLGVGQTGKPQRYCLRGDRIVIAPAPDAVYKIKLFYYLQPPLLTPLTSTSNGLITGTSIGTRQYAVSAAAVLWQANLTSSQTLSTAFRGEIVRTTGWCEVVAQAEVLTLTALNYQFAGTSDQSLVIGGFGGDYIVAEGQSPFPPLPEEYQRLLADLTAAEICRQRRFFDAQQAIEDKCMSVIMAFRDHIQPRAQQNHRSIVWNNVYSGEIARGG